MLKKITAIMLVILAAVLCSACSVFNIDNTDIDESKLDFETQLGGPQAGEKIAVITTSKGVVKIKFFPQYAPKAVENFLTLAEEGYYNNTYVFCVNRDMAFMAGSPDRQGTEYKSAVNDGKPFDSEYTDALWHFPGSVSALSETKNKGDSRFFIIGDCTVSDELQKNMQKSGYPDSLIEMYKKTGGLPTLDRRYAVFAQVFEGMEVVNSINSVETDPKTGVPVEDIMIEKVEIVNYRKAEN